VSSGAADAGAPALSKEASYVFHVGGKHIGKTGFDPHWTDTEFPGSVFVAETAESAVAQAKGGLKEKAIYAIDRSTVDGGVPGFRGETKLKLAKRRER
jgi:hypothetical protein